MSVSNTSASESKHTAQRVAAILLAERRRIAMAFRAIDATTAERAAELKTLQLRHDAPFDDLLRLGVIHQRERLFWFDETKYESAIERPRFRTVGMVVVLLIFALLVWAFVGVMNA